jgi:hypothetical protein
MVSGRASVETPKSTSPPSGYCTAGAWLFYILRIDKVLEVGAKVKLLNASPCEVIHRSTIRQMKSFVKRFATTFDTNYRTKLSVGPMLWAPFILRSFQSWTLGALSHQAGGSGIQD